MVMMYVQVLYLLRLGRSMTIEAGAQGDKDQTAMFGVNHYHLMCIPGNLQVQLQGEHAGSFII